MTSVDVCRVMSALCKQTNNKQIAIYNIDVMK